MSEVINEEMTEIEIIKVIANMDSSIEEYNTYKAENNRKKLLQKRKELDDLLSKRKNDILDKEHNEINDLKEKFVDLKNDFLKEKNRLDLIQIDVNKILLYNARKNLDRKKLQAPSVKYSYGEIKLIAEKINNNSFFAKLMKVLKIDGYDSNINMTMDLINRINASKTYINEEIKKVDEKYKKESQQIKEKYMQLSNNQKITADEEQENKEELDRLQKNFENEKKGFINSLKIEENFDKLDKIFKQFYFKDNLFKISEDIKISNNENKILFGTVLANIKNKSAIEEIKKHNIISKYNFVRQNDDAIDIYVPVLKDVNSLKLLFDMSDRADCLQDNNFAQFLRELCYRYIRTLPFDELIISYIDPEDRGSNAGFLQKMAMDDKCKVVNPIVTSEDSITDKFIELEETIDEIIKKIVGYKNVKTYNEMESEKIPHQLVIINDFPTGFTVTSLERLKIIIKNAQKCGISFVISRDMKTYSENIEKCRNIGKEIDELVEKNFERFYKDNESCYSDLEKKSKVELAITNNSGTPSSSEKEFIELVLKESKKKKD